MPAVPSWLLEPLWDQFSALLPDRPAYDPSHPLGCHRPRISDRVIFEKLIQVLRIRRDAGPTRGPWESKEIAYGITSLPAGLAGPRHLAVYARNHWAIENREHYVRDVTFREDAQKTRTGSQSNAHAGIRNLVTGAFRKKGNANIAAARRYYGRDDQHILALYGYL